MITLKGIFWRPGINGLGVRGMHNLPYRKRFDQAARHHDWLYDISGDGGDRRFADINFLYMCVRQCETDFQCFFAILYFIAVRLFGWAFFRYNRR